jgi:predicted outer membrane repeat protein
MERLLARGIRQRRSLTNCILQNNTTTKEGGAIRASGAAITLAGCTLSGNTSQIGGSVYVINKGVLRGDGQFQGSDELRCAAELRPGQLAPNSPTAVMSFSGACRFIDRGPDYTDRPSLYVDVGGTSPGTPPPS